VGLDSSSWSFLAERLDSFVRLRLHDVLYCEGYKGKQGNDEHNMGNPVCPEAKVSPRRGLDIDCLLHVRDMERHADERPEDTEKKNHPNSRR